MKFYIVLEDGSKHIKKFETLRDFWKWESKHYVKEIKTLEESETYLFEDVQGDRVQG